MNQYRVLLNGQNFLLRIDDSTKKYGFYATRDVEAQSLEDAEINAVEVLRNENTLTSITLNAKDDSPVIYVDEMRILQGDEESLNNSGYSYYIEEDEGS